jgi:hypothetical protein
VLEFLSNSDFALLRMSFMTIPLIFPIFYFSRTDFPLRTNFLFLTSCAHHNYAS